MPPTPKFTKFKAGDTAKIRTISVPDIDGKVVTITRVGSMNGEIIENWFIHPISNRENWLGDDDLDLIHVDVPEFTTIEQANEWLKHASTT